MFFRLSGWLLVFTLGSQRLSGKFAFGSFVVITLLLVWNFNSVTMTIRDEFDASLVPWPGQRYVSGVSVRSLQFSYNYMVGSEFEISLTPVSHFKGNRFKTFARSKTTAISNLTDRKPYAVPLSSIPES